MATIKYADINSLRRFKTNIENEIPTKTSDLTNDSGFINDVPKVTNNQWGAYPFVKNDGVMEVGKYVDFHNETSDRDKDTRLAVDGNYNNTVLLPTESGRLALTNDIPEALDSLPVGSEIDFDGNVSDIPIGWEQVDDEIYNSIYYKAGDTYSVSNILPSAGWITGGSTNIGCQVTLPKKLTNISAITVNGYDITVRHVGGGYALSRATSGLTISVVKIDDCNININIVSPNALSVTNNTPVAVAFYGLNLTFN